MNTFEYRAARSLEEALALLAEYGDEAKLIAGGTALVILMKQQLVQPGCLIGLQGVPELAGVRLAEGGLVAGALATHRELEVSPAVARHWPALAATFARVATIRIRNVATIGGNLAHGDPALDPPVTLTALDAQVRLASARGDRLVPLDELFVDYYETAIQPDEILAELRVPPMPPRSAAAFLKFLPRTEDDYGTVTVAVRLTVDASGARCEDVRIALGAAGATTLRARGGEAVLRGQTIGDEVFREAGAVARGEADPLSDIRGSSAYKRDMVAVFVRRALVQAQGALAARDGADGSVGA